ncbi:hypothetical protein KR044_001111 [Drosophila immigrans]|nr:hypothetical protein KR044_001111 [Drosophila immigrans]
MKILQLVAVIALCAVAANAAPRSQVLRFHQVTREEYDELLKLTNEQGEVSEARLLSSPLNGIKHLAHKTGLSSSGYIPSFFDYEKKKSKKVYPLCVISSDDDGEKSLGHHGYEDEMGNEGEPNEPENPVDEPSPTFCTLVVQGSSSDSNVVYLPKPKPKPRPKPQRPHRPHHPDHPGTPTHPNHPNHPNYPPHPGHGHHSPYPPPIWGWYPIYYPPPGYHHGPHGPHGPRPPPPPPQPPTCDPADPECE